MAARRTLPPGPTYISLAEAAEIERPAIEDLADFFTSSFIPPDVANRFAAALDHFWDGNFDEALFVCLPRLETAIRLLCRKLDLVVFIEPVDPRVGGLKLLATLVADLAGHLEERRRNYLKQLLVEPRSYNLRNRALHGLIPESSASEAALALHVACMLTLLEVEDRPVSD